METFKMDVVAENGIPFRVVVLVKGRSENFVTASMGERSLVEFYDMRYSHTPDGQFTGHRIYLHDAIVAPEFILDYGVEDWRIDSVTSRMVREWMLSLSASGSVNL